MVFYKKAQLEKNIIMSTAAELYSVLKAN